MYIKRGGIDSSEALGKNLTIIGGNAPSFAWTGKRCNRRNDWAESA